MYISSASALYQLFFHRVIPRTSVGKNNFHGDRGGEGRALAAFDARKGYGVEISSPVSVLRL